MLAKNETVDPPVVEIFPDEAVFDGNRPTEFKAGEYYSIFQFKTIRGRIYAEQDFKEVVILVYDQDGQLLFRKTYPVENG